MQYNMQKCIAIKSSLCLVSESKCDFTESASTNEALKWLKMAKSIKDGGWEDGLKLLH